MGYEDRVYSILSPFAISIKDFRLSRSYITDLHRYSRIA